MFFLKNRISTSIIFLMFLSNCRDIRSKRNLSVRIPICNHLFVEKYSIATGGAHDGDIESVYLTDSSNFRFFIRTIDNAHESIGFECHGIDSVRIIKLLPDEATHTFKPVSRMLVSISELRKKGIFD
jgi:hypothetical protein